jgi:hypothetical protein
MGREEARFGKVLSSPAPLGANLEPVHARGRRFCDQFENRATCRVVDKRMIILMRKVATGPLRLSASTVSHEDLCLPDAFVGLIK